MSFWGPPPWDIGIDWEGIRAKKVTGLLAASPFLEEAGRLLYGASLLWSGRVRARELRVLAHEVFGLGGRLRRNALSHHTAQLMLINLGGERTLHAPDQLPVQHPGAASVMAFTGLYLASGACGIMRRVDNLQQLDSGVYEKLIENLEDKIEIASESPACRPEVQPTREALTALHDAAIQKCCEILCCAAGDWCYQVRIPEGKRLHQAWHNRASTYRLAQEMRFRGYTEGCGNGPVRTAIAAARAQEYSPSVSGWMEPFASRAEVLKNMRLVTTFIELLSSMCMEQSGLAHRHRGHEEKIRALLPR